MLFHARLEDWYQPALMTLFYLTVYRHQTWVRINR